MYIYIYANIYIYIGVRGSPERRIFSWARWEGGLLRILVSVPTRPDRQFCPPLVPYRKGRFWSVCFAIFLPSRRPPGGLPEASRRPPGGLPEASRRLPRGLLAASRRSPSGLPASWRLPAASRTPFGGSRRAASRRPPGGLRLPPTPLAPIRPCGACWYIYIYIVFHCDYLHVPGLCIHGYVRRLCTEVMYGGYVRRLCTEVMYRRWA